VFGSIQWHGVQMFADNVTSGVCIEVHPAAVLSFSEDNTRIQQVSNVDWRIWSTTRMKMSALKIPGDIWESMFLGTDLLVQEGGSNDWTGGFTARLVYGVREKAGPGWVWVDIYMFNEYQPVSVAAGYRYDF
jgi:hypothetical protein